MHNTTPTVYRIDVSIVRYCDVGRTHCCPLSFARTDSLAVRVTREGTWEVACESTPWVTRFTRRWRTPLLPPHLGVRVTQQLEALGQRSRWQWLLRGGRGGGGSRLGMSLGTLLCAHRREKRLQRRGGLGPPSQQLGAPVGVRILVRVRLGLGLGLGLG